MKFFKIIWNSQTISQITGVISILCWLIVFVPQIYQNYQRKSTKGLSQTFIVMWLIGDIFNLAGAILQHLIFTMILLAAYYIVADLGLWIQCWFYRKSKPLISVDPFSCTSTDDNVLDELLFELQHPLDNDGNQDNKSSRSFSEAQKVSFHKIFGSIPKFSSLLAMLISILYNLTIVFSVMLAGFILWYLFHTINPNSKQKEPDLNLDLPAQILGYLSALFYLVSRVPQLLLNYKRKSCEGISFWFFTFACMGNITYVISVLSVSLDSRYLCVNLSWLIGSIGTFLMDFLIFFQFFVYTSAVKSKPSSSKVQRQNV